MYSQDFENKYCCLCRQTTRHSKKGERETCSMCGREKWPALCGVSKEALGTSRRPPDGVSGYSGTSGVAALERKS